MLRETKFNSARMYAAAEGGFSTATDVAEYLVKKGVPFRKSHEIVGKIVAYCLKNNIGLEQLSSDDYQKFYEGSAPISGSV